MTENQDTQNNYLENFKPFFWIMGIGFLLYLPTLFFNFTYLDDNNLILNNQYFLSNIANIFPSFLTDVFHLFNSSAFYYRPLLTISFIFDYQINGASPFMYHFTDIVLHVASACFLFVLLTKLNYKRALSFLFSIIFLVHPVLTQAIAWIPGRNDSLLAFFAIPSFIFFLNYLKEKKVGSLIYSLLFFGLALFTKESAICLVPVMLFYLIFIYKEEKLSLQKFYFFFWSLIPLALWAILRHFALSGSPLLSPIGMVESIFFNSPAVIQLMGKIFFPFNLSVLPIIQDTTFIYGIISIILLAIMFFFAKNKRWNFILFGFLWFFAFLLPSFIRPNTALVADFIEHRLYVPIIGIFIVLLEMSFIQKIDLKKKTTLFIAGSIIILFSVITIIHSQNFANRLAFWNNAVQNSPHYPLAHRNLGAMEYLDGNIDTAEKEFKKALELNPTEQMAHNNLGLVYAKKGQLQEAENEYKKEIEVNPYYDDVYFNLGLLYWNEKKYEDAKTNWGKTLSLNPNYVDAYSALATYYYSQKDIKNATLYAGAAYQRGATLAPPLLQLLRNY